MPVDVTRTIDFAAITEEKSDPVVIVEGRSIIYANRAAVESLVLESGAQLVGSDIKELLQAAERVHLEPDSADEVYLKGLGDIVWAVRSSLVTLGGGKKGTYLDFGQVSLRAKMLAELPTHNPNPIIKIALKPSGGHTLLYCNPQARRHFPALGESPRIPQFGGDDYPELFDGLSDVDAEEEISSYRGGGKRYTRRDVTVGDRGDGERHYCQRIVQYADKTALMFFSDQTDLIETQRQLKEVNRKLAELNVQLEELAIKDSLTNIPNHRSLMEELGRQISSAFRHGQPLGVMMIDVDHFKTINDQYGHPEGDAVLRTVAEILMDTKREEDVVCRYGGDEFTVVLPQTDSEGVRIAAERLRRNVEKHSRITFGDRQLPKVTITVGGFSVVPDNNTQPEYMIKLADGALCWLKQKGDSGRNQVSIAEVSYVGSSDVRFSSRPPGISSHPPGKGE